MSDFYSRWPKWLFIGTLAAALVFGSVSAVYAIYTSRVQTKQQEFVKAKAEYEQRIKDLQTQLIVKKTVTTQVPTPVTENKCTPVNLGIVVHQVCVPALRIEMRNIQTTVDATDPKVQQELDATLARLNALSAAAKETQQVVFNFEPFYEFVQKMMKPLISLIVLGVSLFIIISKDYKAEAEKWAFGSLGTVIGIWLR